MRFSGCLVMAPDGRTVGRTDIDKTKSPCLWRGIKTAMLLSELDVLDALTASDLDIA